VRLSDNQAKEFLMTKTAQVAPIMPARSMDFNELEAALKKGESDEDAIALACGDKTASKSPTDSSNKAEKKG
jgi:hypothetical protein